MPIARRFIDWRQPSLAAAVEFLVERYRSGQMLDLRNVILALPGGRAGRRLLELLVDRAEALSLALVPPRVLTAGHLTEELYPEQKQFADDFTQHLAWIEALQESDEELVDRVIPHRPDKNDLFAWLALTELLAQLHRELAAELLDFNDVIERGPQLATFAEAKRWQALAELQRNYLRVLDQLDVWDQQTARKVAVEKRECRTDCDIVLVGIVELNAVQRAMLEQVAERVTALVFAPSELAERFDDFGCLRLAAWQEADIDLPADRVEIVEGPGDQADAVLRTIAALDGQYAAEEITVGVQEGESLVPYLEQRFEECGIAARHGVGRSIQQTAPFRLLEAIADYLQTGRFASFAALVRHPDLTRWLLGRDIRGDWLTALDNYHSDHLPSRPPKQWGDDLMQQVYESVGQLLNGLTGKAQPLHEWSDAVVKLLLEVYGTRDLQQERDADRELSASCEKVAIAAQSLASAATQLSPRLTGAEALRLILREVEGEHIPPRAEAAAIELVGWLELRLDDAPVIIVTGFNEGLVPSARNGDQFLPNELRRQLHLMDNDHHYARDAYALAALCASRKELRIIAGRRTAKNDPLIPSRLLFARPAAELPGRVERYFNARPTQPLSRIAAGLRPGQTSVNLVVPRPQKLPETVTKMRVTEFRDYLACPYRYYLKYRLDLKTRDDTADELDGGLFGSLLHDVFRIFGEGQLTTVTTDAEAIRRELHAALDGLARKRFGKSSLPAVTLQVEQVRQRLDAFSRWQAGWAREGWRIRYVEEVIDQEQAPFVVDGKPMYLQGRIDRVDVNERDGICVVFDYKTGDQAETPEKSHRTAAGDWVDLQLPLYRHVVRALEIDGPVKLGYIVVPRDMSEGKTGAQIAEWTDAELAAADAVAANIVRKVRDEIFWPRTSPPPSFAEEFAAICQDGRLGGETEEESNDD